MKNYISTIVLASVLMTSVGSAAENDGWLPASYDHLPRWRGFNLCNKKKVSENTPFKEEEFQIIHDLGFNFARLPMDYRIWIKDGDWTKFNEDALKEIDQAIDWGEKYKVHINLNMHRIPGYICSNPPEPRSLWKEEEVQKVAALHWAMFAKRYKGIPNERLSFNLINEPRRYVDTKDYIKVVTLLVEAIRKEDPNRLIIVDGLQSATAPCKELVPLKVAQATRGYFPMWISHCNAPWVANNPKGEPVPTWPMIRVSPHLDAGTTSTKSRGPLEISGEFPAQTRISLVLSQTDGRGRLIIRSNSAKIFEKVSPEVDVPMVIETGSAASKIVVSNEGGGSLSLKSLNLKLPNNQESYDLPILPPSEFREQIASQVVFTPKREALPWGGEAEFGVEWLRKTEVTPWKNLETQGVGIMVGEWGAFNTAPYETTLKWMEDTLKLYKEANMGWALWNLSGGFGVLDSERQGAVYEDYRGHKLDRRMLEILKKY